MRLIIEIDYDLNGVPVESMIQALKRIPMNAAGDGWFTGSTEAEVDAYSVKVEDLTADIENPQVKKGEQVVCNHAEDACPPSCKHRDPHYADDSCWQDTCTRFGPEAICKPRLKAP